MSRRAINKLLLTVPALPAVALAEAQSQEVPRGSAFASCLAASDTALGADERARLEKGLANLEQALNAIREFKLPADAAPGLRFSAMTSPRGR